MAIEQAPDPDTPERQKLREERIAWLEKEIRGLDREMQTTKWVLAAALLAIPISIVWGVIFGVVEVFFTCTMYGVAVYLVGVRRSEYEFELKQVKNPSKHRGWRK